MLWQAKSKNRINNTQSKSEWDWMWQVWTKQQAVKEWMRLDVASPNQTIRSQRVNATGRGKSEPNNTQSKSECDWMWQVWTKQYAVKEWMRLDVASLNQTIRSQRVNATGCGKSEPNSLQTWMGSLCNKPGFSAQLSVGVSHKWDDCACGHVAGAVVVINNVWASLTKHPIPQ